MMDRSRLRRCYEIARTSLFRERTPEGFWIGELSTSALSTATAVSALAMVDRAFASHPNQSLIERGIGWLAEHQNQDGGWGDTVKSLSNISTTMLCRAAFHITQQREKHSQVLLRCETWLSRYGKTAQELAEAVRQRYGKDRTFSVPILTMCAIAELVPWNEVPRLPFEMACLPQSWYRFAGLPVVSYALPALIAIGQCVHHHRSTWNPITLLFRRLGRNRALRVLERMQPSSGGYLEAAPLTSFVVMSLCASAIRLGKWNPHAERVMREGVRFLIETVRSDGSWPIDTNLSVWVTTLSVNALAAAGDLDSLDNREQLRAWLLNQQTLQRHPFTGADPGGWGWSHLPGSVPDCDDTPGMLLALRQLTTEDLGAEIDRFIRETVGKFRFTEEDFANLPQGHLKRGDVAFHVLAGLGWLDSLQNSDGGWPTFCRGWGKLPFDRSGTDLTAHVLRAFVAWRSTLPVSARVAGIVAQHMGATLKVGDADIRLGASPRESIERAFRYLAKQQRPDGSWLPLWFGNQYAPDDINPVYGTVKVLAAYRDLQLLDLPEARHGIEFLLAVQNSDGGWGGAKDTPSNVEETALVVEMFANIDEALIRDAVERGVEYLFHRVEAGTFEAAAPIGFYFAKLWYFEKLYPIIFTVAALGRVLRRTGLN